MTAGERIVIGANLVDVVTARLSSADHGVDLFL
jgi:hypothetical protein